MTTIGLLALIGLLLALRQPLFVLLGAATCYVYLFFGDGVLGNVVEDIWNSVEQEMLLSIPLFMLAGTTTMPLVGYVPLAMGARRSFIG